MKFVVLGHFVFDRIHTSDGKEYTGFGGVYYPLAALALLSSKNDTIFPVFGVSVDDFETVIAAVKKLPNVDPSGIYTFKEPTNSVNLFYSKDAERVECSRDIARPIPFSAIEKFLTCDGILINMFSGFDLTLETLDQIRMSVRNRETKIHLDIHCLPKGINEDGTRFPRPVPEWRRWCFMLDSVQMNEDEAHSLTSDMPAEDSLAKGMLAVAAKNVVITRGHQGISHYSLHERLPKRADYPAIPVQTVNDTTGAGDIFGAAFLYSITSGVTGPEAIHSGLRAASARTMLKGPEEIHKLTDAIQSLSGQITP